MHLKVSDNLIMRREEKRDTQRIYHEIEQVTKGRYCLCSREDGEKVKISNMIKLTQNVLL